MKNRICIFILSIGFCLCSNAAETDRYIGISKKYPGGSNAISSDGLVAAFDFETFTDNGLLHDFGPFGLHAKLENRKSTPGRFGQALVFSRKEDVVILPNNDQLNLTGPITVTAQLKIETPGLHQHIFACNDLFVLWLTTGNKYRFADTLGQGLTTNEQVSVVNDGDWHSVVAVLSAAKGAPLSPENIKIFVDGKQLQGKHEKNWAPTKLADNNACVIGGTRTGAQSHQDLQFEGVIDELQIYSRALSDEEIKAYSNLF